MNIHDLINDLKTLEADHEPEGWPAVKMWQISALINYIEILQGFMNTRLAEISMELEKYRKENNSTIKRVLDNLPKARTQL
jgi:hypothetical protein